MGLVAGIAGETARVVGGNNLRKALGLRRIRFMAADTQYCRIQFFGSHGRRIIRVLA